jgi:hypothetical protein
MSLLGQIEFKTPAGFIRRENPVARRLGLYHPGLFFTSNDSSLRVMITEEVHEGLTFLHVTMSRRSRYPSYEDMQWVKNSFIGKDNQAVQVLPKEGQHVNIHDYCLHLWHCYEKELFPSHSTMSTV